MRHGSQMMREKLTMEQEVGRMEARIHGLTVVVDKGFVRRWRWWQGEIKRDKEGSISCWGVRRAGRYPAVDFDGRRVVDVDVCIVGE